MLKLIFNKVEYCYEKLLHQMEFVSGYIYFFYIGRFIQGNKSTKTF